MGDVMCPNFEDHTLCPEGYISWHIWAEEMAKTHKQRKCPGCGRYSIWEPRLGTGTVEHNLTEV